MGFMGLTHSNLFCMAILGKSFSSMGHCPALLVTTHQDYRHYVYHPIWYKLCVNLCVKQHHSFIQFCAVQKIFLKRNSLLPLSVTKSSNAHGGNIGQRYIGIRWLCCFTTCKGFCMCTCYGYVGTILTDCLIWFPSTHLPTYSSGLQSFFIT